MNEICKDCWWKNICKKSKKACNELQLVDLHWNESPNNKYRNKITRNHNLKAINNLQRGTD